MSKIHPNDAQLCRHIVIDDRLCKPSPITLTVWKKSLVLSCNGFTVFDSNGNLQFRVDNYPSNPTNEFILMDAAGTPLLTMRRKKHSVRSEWDGFLGDAHRAQKRMFSVRRPLLFGRKALAEVSDKQRKVLDCRIEGSYSKRSCTVCSSCCNTIIAQVKPKQATPEITLGTDVFSLVVQPGFDQAFVMGLILFLDLFIS